MTSCPHCESRVEARHRFCPWCGRALRTKLVEFFPANAAIEGDRGRALRVSRYLSGAEGRHTRFSIWQPDGSAAAAVSLDDAEAARLASFLQGTAPPAERQSLFERLARR
ncbi:MAG TPA: zinc ribbon domain-containing protein [Gaiellales bacterium]|jgi:hypothetical protein|nr:zinc ribbon domain-containing protein [Gaiellales bacterium]